MAFYDEMAALALELLTEFGSSVSIYRVDGRAIDPVSGAVTAGTPSTLTTTGVMRSYKSELVDGVNVLRGDRELVLSNEQTPTLSDLIVFGSDKWRVINVSTVRPDNATAIVHFVQVRK
jgi:hypothetical protein